MPNRILREGILTSERVARLGWPDEVFYRRLMSVVDDFGRYHANPKLLRAALYPLLIDKVSDADIGKWLTSCVNAALVSVYPAPDGKRYLQLLDFRQQARADKSKYPPMPSKCAADATQVLSTGAADAPVFGGGVGDVVVLPIADAMGVAGSAADPPRLHVVPTEAKPIDCPQQLVIEAYHRELPTCRQVREWNATRQGFLRQRWKEKATDLGWSTEAEGIAWFVAFFGYVARSKFLTGRTATGNGREPFVADLEWLLRPGNFAKVIEGKYE